MRNFRAVVAPMAGLEDVAAEFPSALLCPLPQGFAFIPLTTPLRSELYRVYSPDYLGYEMLLVNQPPCVSTLASRVSEVCGRASVIVIESFGPCATQSVTSWRDGKLAFSNALTGYPASFDRAHVNAVLHDIGVKRQPGRDEYDTLGLSEYSDTYH